MRLILSFVLLVAAAPAQASDLSLMISGVTYHFNRESICTEANLGLGLHKEYDNNVALLGGFYKNTHCDYSWYGGTMVWSDFYMSRVRLGGLFAGVTNYEKAVTLLAAPVLEVKLSKLWYQDTIYVPSNKGEDHAVVTFWLRRVW